MRETRQSGSEGGARYNPLSLPLSPNQDTADSVWHLTCWQYMVEPLTCAALANHAVTRALTSPCTSLFLCWSSSSYSLASGPREPI